MYIRPAFKILKTGEHVIFQCESFGNTIWRFNNRLPPSNTEQTNSNHTELKIDCVIPENEGIYECEGTNCKGETFIARAKLLIRGMVQ